MTSHGHTRVGRPRSPTYVVWGSMLSRCSNPKVKAYLKYGARGIVVCERWQSFANFLADMGERPAGLTLERRDNSKGYDSENCYWATRTDQNRNRSNSIFTFDLAQEAIGRYEHGESRKSICARMGVSVSHLGHLIRGTIWREIDRPYLQKSANNDKEAEVS